LAAPRSKTALALLEKESSPICHEYFELMCLENFDLCPGALLSTKIAVNMNCFGFFLPQPQLFEGFFKKERRK